MHRLLIPLLACFFLCTPALLRAQVPHEIKIAKNAVFPAQPAQPDAPCGNAGTITFSQITGSSNDGAPPPIFLCFGDQFTVTHNGNADLSGDPNPATTPGIAFAFYSCAPTVDGPTLQSIATIPGPGDPCVLPGSSTGLFVTQAVPNGGTTQFFNNGTLQTAFNMGQPLSLFFAPITVDDFANNNYESGQVGFPPGPCVAVNTAAAFEVVYLNAITATGINNNFGNDCLGRFTIRGGYPQYDNNAVYTINISLASNPNIKAIVHNAADQLFHQASVVFSVPQSGLYDVVVEDGKGCPFSFQIDMNVCDPSDNLTLNLPNTVVPPGGQICVPITTQNFNIISGSFSINWDPAVLQYTGINNLHPALDPFTGTTLNDLNANNGRLGFILVDDQVGGLLTVPNDATLFELCFNAVGQLGDCTPIAVTNNPTFIAWENQTGQNLGFTANQGQVCIAFLPLALNAQVVNPTCLGTGTLQVTPSGGVEPYEVTVRENPQGMPPGPTYFGVVNTSGQFFTVNDVGSTNNTPVTYEICIEDNNGNGAQICTTIVVLIPRLGAQINFVQQPLCNGQSNGTITAVVLEGGITVPNPGPPTYSFAWQNVANPNITGTGQTLNNIPAGPYQLTVTNNMTGCSEVALGTLGQPAPISRELLTVTPASCSGICDGSFTYEVEGGTPFSGTNYQYTLTYTPNGTTVGSGSGNPITLANACSGAYSLMVTDQNGCTFTDNNINVTDQRALDIVPNIINSALCFGQSSGSTTVTLTESVPSGNAFTFFWAPSGGTQTDNGLVSTYSNLAAGTYTVVAVDALGCQASEEITIGQPTQLRIDSLGQTNPGCAFVNSGSISVQAFGGTGQGSYTYSWNVAGSSNSLNGLPPGTYTVQVTDGNGCTATRQFVLPVPAPPTITDVNVQSVGCGSSGSLTVTAPTGTVFVWTTINGTVIDSSATISNLSGGSYIYKVYDATGCLATDTVTLASVDALAISNTTLQQPSCFGYADGQIAIGVQGGNPPYVSYNWSPTQPNQSVIFNVPAGNYTVTVTDNIGCTVSQSFVLDQPPAIVNTFSASVNGRVSCFGFCDGAAAPVVLYATNPPTPGDFAFLWQDGVTDSLRTDLCAGPNAVIIQDPFNCFILDTVVITTPPQITAQSQSTTPADCFGASTGSASVTATGGNGSPYTYLWNTGATTPTITNVPAGPYAVTITDKNGCTNAINTNLTVGEPDPILLSTTPNNPDCFGKNTGTIKVDATGGTPAYSYLWQNAAGANVGNAQVAQMIGAGNYTVTVTDLKGCTASTTATLQDPPPVVGDYVEPAPLACFGDQAILTINTITGGSGGPYTFSIDFGAPLSIDFPVRIGGGKHYITYYDGKGCDFTDSTSLFVPEPAPITVQFNPNSVEIELGDKYKLSPIVSIGGAAIKSFSWTNLETLINPTDFDLTEAYPFTTTTYTLTVIDTAGCTGTGKITVNIDPNRNVYIPNVFKPGNSSGLNDFFNVYTGLGVEMVNFFRIYDRWGDLMYQRERFVPNSFDLAEGWDGRFNGKYVNPGVFVYVAEVRFLDGRVLTYRGDVTVIR